MTDPTAPAAGGVYLDDADKTAINHFLLTLVGNITKEIPPVLWHYTTADGLIGILKDKKIRAGHISGMNDAYEFRYSIGSLMQATDFRLKQENGLPEEIRAMLHRLRDGLTNVPLEKIPPVFVSCFSSTVDQASQWGEYGDRGKGYALAFRANDLFQIASEQNIFAIRCVYDDREIAMIMAAIVLTAERVFTEVRKKRQDVELPKLIEDFLQFYVWNLSYLAPVFKHKSFAPEAEWRYTLRLPDYDYSRMTFVAKRSELRPYIEFDFVRKAVPTTGLVPLAQVLIGPARSEIDSELAVIAVKALLAKYGHKDIPVTLSVSGYRG